MATFKTEKLFFIMATGMEIVSYGFDIFHNVSNLLA